MRMIVNNKITLYEAPPELTKQIKQALTLPNPLWHKLRYINPKACYGVPKEFIYYQIDKRTGGLIVPRGLRHRLLEYVAGHNVQTYITDSAQRPGLRSPFASNIKLRDYQYGIIDEIDPERNREGILRCDTGWGKTVLALKLIEKLQTPTLIIVPQTTILEQFREMIKKSFGFDAGIIQGKDQTIADITLATWQTLARRPELCQEISNEFGMIIVDECHSAVSDKRMKILSGFNHRHCYGMSGTPFRSNDDGRTEVIKFIFGEILVDKRLPATKPTVEIINYYGKIEANFQYAQMVEAQAQSPHRNDFVASIIRREIDRGRKVLVLTKRCSMYQCLSDRIGREGVYQITAKGSQKNRTKELDKYRSGDTPFSCLLGTLSLLGVGFDMPSLDCLVLACDLKSNLLTTQAGGRLLRVFEGKPNPKIIDVVDVKNGVFIKQAKERQKVYKELGWIIEET